MEAITTNKSWPKFLKVDGTVVAKMTHNKHLLKPWENNEIVKVVSYEEQKSYLKTEKAKFLEKYVNVVRKDDDGNWSLPYTAEWKMLKPINKK